MEFIPLDEASYRTLLSWFDDPLLRRWYGPPTDTWLHYVHNEPGVYVWMVHENQTPIGHIQMDIHEDGVGYIGFIINPGLRNQGYGRRMISEFLGLPEISRTSRVIAEVEVENYASINCLLAVGFIVENPQPNEQGFISYSIIPPRNLPQP